MPIRPAIDRSGFVLPLVLIVLALLTVMSMALSQMARDRVAAIQLRKSLWEHEKQAQAAAQAALYTLLSGDYEVRESKAGSMTLNLDGRVSELMGTRLTVQDGAGLFSLAQYDRSKFQRLLEKLTDSKTAQDISAELADWIDDDSRKQFRGLEAAGYRSRGLPQRPRNAPIRSIEELLELPSMTPQIFFGAAGKPGLRDLVLAGGSDHFNIGTAPDMVLGPMLGMGGGEESRLLAAKQAQDWRQMLEMVPVNDWVFNQVYPFAHGTRYVVSFSAPNARAIRMQVALDPYSADLPYKLIDWRAPDYGDG